MSNGDRYQEKYKNAKEIANLRFMKCDIIFALY